MRRVHSAHACLHAYQHRMLSIASYSGENSSMKRQLLMLQTVLPAQSQSSWSRRRFGLQGAATPACGAVRIACAARGARCRAAQARAHGSEPRVLPWTGLAPRHARRRPRLPARERTATPSAAAAGRRQPWTRGRAPAVAGVSACFFLHSSLTTDTNSQRRTS